jgi:hypothetical protein
LRRADFVFAQPGFDDFQMTLAYETPRFVRGSPIFVCNALFSMDSHLWLALSVPVRRRDILSRARILLKKP